MEKIKSLFKRDYEGTRLVYDEVVPGCSWVIAGEGLPTIKYDGTCCMIRARELFKRYDRKLTKPAHRRKKKDSGFVLSIEDFKPAPEGWEPAEVNPDIHTGHWPGWVPIGYSPEDQYHRESLDDLVNHGVNVLDGTYELVGPKVQSNPYNLSKHLLVGHGHLLHRCFLIVPSCEFESLKAFFQIAQIEGIVWHHQDGRMVKVKRSDFGFEWPSEDLKRKAVTATMPDFEI